MLAFWRRFKRADVIAADMPERWRAVVQASVPLARALPRTEREKLETLVRIFLSEKHFEGAGGLEVTDEMRVAIAARACLLVLGRLETDDALYPDLETVLIYPRAYRARSTRSDGAVVIEEDQVRLGESWSRGLVVLTWDAVKEGSARAHDGHDVVLHEFAHQLDAEDGAVDGAPDLEERGRYAAWARVFGAEYEELVRAVHRGREGVLDAYGATNAPEFFAVATEAFFERPLELRRSAPELYEQLRGFFRLDPAALMASRRR